MRRYVPFLVALLASAPAAAQTYKWVDERGITTYGPKPPAGRPAQRVDTRFPNTIETGALPKRAEPEPRRETITPPTPAAEAVRGMVFDTYIRLEPGMTEGELLTRAGKPDYIALDALGRESVKSFYYYPTRGDPFITVVTLRGGRIDHIERMKKN